MTSTVIARMKVCGKTNRVTVSLRENGDTMDVTIDSDCPHVRDYASKLRTITMSDVISHAGSKVEDPEIRASLSVPCLTPIAVFNAAWMELGMLSKGRAKLVGDNCVDFSEA